MFGQLAKTLLRSQVIRANFTVTKFSSSSYMLSGTGDRTFRYGKHITSKKSNGESNPEGVEESKPKPLIPEEEILDEYYSLLSAHPHQIPWDFTEDLKSTLRSGASRTTRLKTYYHFCRKEKRMLREQVDDSHSKGLENADNLKSNESGHKYAAEGKIMIWTRAITIRRWRLNKLWHEIQFGQNIVIDGRYEQTCNFTSIDLYKYRESLEKMDASNFELPTPFHLHICNVDMQSSLNSAKARFHQEQSNGFFFSMHKENYLDLFDKQKLVYLTPYVRNVIPDNYDRDAVYIIGGIPANNYTRQSLSVAKSEGLPRYCLPHPLRSYQRCTVYPIPVVFRVLAEAARCGSFREAVDKKIRVNTENEQLLNAKSKEMNQVRFAQKVRLAKKVERFIPRQKRFQGDNIF